MSLNPETLRQYEALTGFHAAELPANRPLAGVADLTGRTLIEMTGSDRMSMLHSFCTNEVKKLAPGQGCEAFITSPQGKVLGHVWIFNTGPALWIESVPGQAEPLIAHLSRYVISEDVTFRDLTPETATLLVAGPDAASVLYGLATQELPEEVPALASLTLQRQPVHVCAVEYAGPKCYLVLVSRASAEAVLAAMQSAGATSCDGAAVEIARIEQGFPLYGQDITDDNLPQEICRDRQAISFTKGCYLGQETVARIDALGHVNRWLVGIQFAGSEVPPVGTKLLAAEKEVGHVTSAVWSPRLAAPLAMALVRRAVAKAGTELSSALGPAQVVALPIAGERGESAPR